MNNKTGRFANRTKKEIILPLMDKNGNELRRGDLAFYSEYSEGGPSSHKYANSLVKLEKDGDLLVTRTLIYTDIKGKFEYKKYDGDSSKEPEMEYHDLNITPDGTYVMDIEKVFGIKEDDDLIVFLNERYPLY